MCLGIASGATFKHYPRGGRRESTELGRRWPNSDQCWPIFAKADLMLTRFGQSLPHVGQRCPTLGPNLVNIDQRWPASANIGPRLAKLDQTSSIPSDRRLGDARMPPRKQCSRTFATRARRLEGGDQPDWCCSWHSFAPRAGAFLEQLRARVSPSNTG